MRFRITAVKNKTKARDNKLSSADECIFSFIFVMVIEHVMSVVPNLIIVCVIILESTWQVPHRHLVDQTPNSIDVPPQSNKKVSLQRTLNRHVESPLAKTARSSIILKMMRDAHLRNPIRLISAGCEDEKHPCLQMDEYGGPRTSQQDCLTPNQLPNKRLLPLAELHKVSETRPLDTCRYSQKRRSQILKIFFIL
jgi:hypothetical protein